MYVNMTYEKILKDMLKNVPSNVDKREGSIIYDALAPCAIELAHSYIELQRVLDETFADTASYEYLVRRGKERDVVPKEATKAILKGEFNINVPIGTRFNLHNLNYVVIEQIEENVFKMECETAGVVGNKNYGTMIPIHYIYGLEKAELTELLIPADDEEDIESFRERYFQTFDSESFGGNIKDYINKSNSLHGVGATKVTSAWDGGGTVKLTILNSQYNSATYELVDFVQQEIDPTKDGQGLGIAPIGHIVTVESAEEVVININTSIVLEETLSFYDIEDEVNNIIEEYLLEIRKAWETNNTSVVRIAQIESKILTIDGVIDILNTTINDYGENFYLSKLQIPILGGVVNG